MSGRSNNCSCSNSRSRGSRNTEQEGGALLFNPSIPAAFRHCTEQVSRSPEPFGFAQGRLREGDEATPTCLSPPTSCYLLSSLLDNPEFKFLAQHLYPGVSREKGVALDEEVHKTEPRRARGGQMAKKRGRQSRLHDVACPNARCKFYGKLGSGTVVSNGTYFVGGMRVRRG